jgi:hypothetical protein
MRAVQLSPERRSNFFAGDRRFGRAIDVASAIVYLQCDHAYPFAGAAQ